VQKWRPTCFDLKIMAPELTWKGFFEVTYFEVFVRQVWENPGKISLHPQKYACSYIHGWRCSLPWKNFCGCPWLFSPFQLTLRYGKVRLQQTMYEFKTKQNILWIWWHNRSWIFYFLLHNCLEGRNLHIVLFIHIVYSWFLNAECNQ